MATPIVFNKVTDWVDYTDPSNVPAQVRVITAADLLRYENGIGDVVQRVNEHDSLLTNAGSSLTQFNERVTQVETVNAAQGTNIAQLTALVNQLQSTLNASLRTTLVRSLTTAYNLVVANRIHVHTGGAATWTLPAVGGTSVGQDFIIHNKGSATLTVNAPNNSFYFGGAVSGTFGLGTNNTLHVVSDGTNWVVLVSDSNASI